MTGRYRLVESIGQGGMGRVWRAADEILDRQVAVKEMRIDGLDPEDTRTRRERTLREARATARIDHPNVVRVYDVVDEGERLWIVMELVAGRSLERMLAEEGPLGPRETARIGLGLVTALRQVHERGVLHRDIKPGNVLVEAGGRGRIVLTDFGIAAIQDAKALTMVGMLVGSPDYMAPERVSGRPQGPQSDVWSLGATLCAALGGRSPFSRDTTLATLHAVLYEEPELPPTAGPLRAVLSALLEKDPTVRPGLADLEAVLHPLAYPAPTPTLPVAAVDAGAAADGWSREQGDGSEGAEADAGFRRQGLEPERPGEGAGGQLEPGAEQRTEPGPGRHLGLERKSGPGVEEPSVPGTAGAAEPQPEGEPAPVPRPIRGSVQEPEAARGGTHEPEPEPEPESVSGPVAELPGPARIPVSEPERERGSVRVSGSGPVVGPDAGGASAPEPESAFGPPTDRTPTTETHRELPGPVKPAAPRRGRRGPRRTGVIATVGALTAGAIVAIVLAANSGSPGDGQAGSPPPSSAASSPADNSSPTVEGTSRPQTLPPGAHREAGGFAWATPGGWRRDVKTGSEVHYTSPDGKQELAAKSSLARGDLMDSWEKSEQNAHQGQNYQKIRLERTTFRGHEAVVWEYTFTLQGVPWHAQLLGFTVDGKSYQINTWYQPDIEAQALKTYKKVRDSFTVL
ncbi:serine/threonine-protein kinase [Streptomyces dysideae]